MIVVAIILILTIIILAIHNRILKNKIDYLETIIMQIMENHNETE